MIWYQQRGAHFGLVLKSGYAASPLGRSAFLAINDGDTTCRAYSYATHGVTTTTSNRVYVHFSLCLKALCHLCSRALFLFANASIASAFAVRTFQPKLSVCHVGEVVFSRLHRVNNGCFRFHQGKSAPILLQCRFCQWHYLIFSDDGLSDTTLCLTYACVFIGQFDFSNHQPWSCYKPTQMHTE